MTNPNNAVGTNGAYGGRTSVNAFNDGLALYTSRGVLSGWEVSPDSGMTVTIGGGSVRDVAVAEDAAGNRTTVNNISGSPISVTLDGAPSSGKRIDLIVGYVDSPPQGTDSAVDNPGTVGLITVSSAAASTPTVPTDSAIRSAITADGAAGSTAYYAVLGQLTIPAGTTDIDSTMVNAVQNAGVGSQNVDYATMAFVAPTTTVTSLPLDTATTIQSVALNTPGKYKITATFNGYSLANDTYKATLKIMKGTSEISHARESFPSVSTNLDISLSAITVIDIQSPATISTVVQIASHSLQQVYPDSCTLIAERIG